MSSQVFSEGATRPARTGRRSRQAETLDRLLTAGSEELRAVGHEALTVRTVAKRAGVSPATAYTYLASRQHLFAELFHAYLLDDEAPVPDLLDPVARTQGVTRRLSERLAAAPELAAAVTPALLSSDPDVDRLRLRIGSLFAERFRAALPDAPDAVRDALLLAFSGALLQAGMGFIGYDDLADRLDGVVAVIVRGHDDIQPTPETTREDRTDERRE